MDISIIIPCQESLLSDCFSQQNRLYKSLYSCPISRQKYPTRKFSLIYRQLSQLFPLNRNILSSSIRDGDLRFDTLQPKSDIRQGSFARKAYSLRSSSRFYTSIKRPNRWSVLHNNSSHQVRQNWPVYALQCHIYPKYGAFLRRCR